VDRDFEHWLLSKQRHKLKSALISGRISQACFHTMRSTGTYVTATTLGEPVRAFVPHQLPPTKPALVSESYQAGARNAELALARRLAAPPWSGPGA
jgi:hypothetical protein